MKDQKKWNDDSVSIVTKEDQKVIHSGGHPSKN